MDPMSIASLSTAMASTQTMSKIGTAVLDMAMSDATAQAAGTIEMMNAMPSSAMELSVNPNLGGGFDTLV